MRGAPSTAGHRVTGKRVADPVCTLQHGGGSKEHVCSSWCGATCGLASAAAGAVAQAQAAQEAHGRVSHREHADAGRAGPGTPCSAAPSCVRLSRCIG